MVALTMPEQSSPCQVAVEITPRNTRRSQLTARLLGSLPMVRPIDSDRHQRTARVLLLCANKAYEAVLIHDEEDQIAGVSLRLKTTGELTGRDRMTFDRVQTKALVARIDPDDEAGEIQIQARSRCTDKDSLRATLDFLAADIARVLADDRLQGLVQV